MRHVGILPLDDRPSHTDIVQDLCSNVDDVQFHYVDKSLLGHFTVAGNTSAIAKELLELASYCDTLIISIDSLVFGGLVQARELGNEKIDVYLDRINLLDEIKQKYPNLQIYAYSIIMRLTTTVTDSSALDLWKNIFDYSRLSEQVKVDKSVLTEFQKVQSKLSPNQWKSYCETRERNHVINKRSVELANNGIIKHLTLVQEDTNPFGPHKREQQVLLQLIDKDKHEKNIWMKNGADEMVALYVAKVLNKSYQIELFNKYMDDGFVACYEDSPAIEGIMKSAAIADIKIVNDGQSDVCIIPPTDGESLDLSMQQQDFTKPIHENFILDSVTMIGSRNYGILDIKDGNGGDIRYVDALVAATGFDKLISYSAWNTANNSIGTFLLGMLVASQYTVPKEVKQIRIIDDAIYQGIVRFEYNQWMREHGYDVWAMNQIDPMSDVLEQMIQKEVNQHEYLKLEIKAYLPWGRSFEAVIKQKEKNYDVVVIGAGSAGVSAAIAAARSGSSTLLVERSSILGGTNTKALVGPITTFLGEHGTPIVGGIPQEIIDRLVKRGASRGHIQDPLDFCYSITPVNFKEMQLVLYEMVKEEKNIDLMLNTNLISTIKDAGSISELLLKSDKETFTVHPNIVIDASGDANVVAMSCHDYVFGRESDGKAQPMSMLFTCRGVDLEQVRDDVANNPQNFVVGQEIKEGKRMGYVAISGYFDEVKNSSDFPVDRDRLLFFQGMHEDEVGLNTTRMYGDDTKSMNDFIQEGQQQVNELFNWLKENIPAFKGAYISDIGEVGVRESRRIIGDLQLSDEDVLFGKIQEDSIAVGSYPIDIHSPDSSKMEFLEDKVTHDFDISYRMLLPKSLTNVIVAGRPISATHSAHAASRVSATCMAIGQSAGIAAHLCSKENVDTRSLEYKILKEAILSYGGIPTKDK